jgi:hypothetical protein
VEIISCLSSFIPPLVFIFPHFSKMNFIFQINSRVTSTAKLDPSTTLPLPEHY